MHPERFFRFSKKFALLAFWGALVATGFWKLSTYSFTSGVPAQPAEQWPSLSQIHRDPLLPTLVIFAHPRCPCSAATVTELERLMPKIKDKVKTTVVFLKPTNHTDDWAKERLWNRVQILPHVQSVLDNGGIEASRFGARTSGQVFLYEKNGSLVFQGGITPARGHAGASAGRDAILSFVEIGRASTSKTPVFGCSLRNPERATAGTSP